MEKYINIIENKKDRNNVLRVRVYYDIGGMNYGTGRAKTRGYYISVSPLERKIKDGYVTETYSAFSGFYELLEPCTRKSKKAEAAALEKAPAYEKIIIDHILKNTGYILEA